MRPHFKATGDPVWDLASRIIAKRIKPSDSAKSILKDFTVLYQGLKRLAPKSVSETPLDLTREFLSSKSERHAIKRRTPRIQ